MSPALTLYVVPGSPPCAAVEVALRTKRLHYRRVDLPPVVHMAFQRAAFGRRTVPGMVIDGQRVVGSRLIMRALDGLAPIPRLLPDDPARRARIEEAETWGDVVLQSLARRLTWAALQRRPDALTSFAADHDLPLPPALAARGGRLVIAVERLVNRLGGTACGRTWTNWTATWRASTPGWRRPARRRAAQRRGSPDRIKPRASQDARRPRSAHRPQVLRPAGAPAFPVVRRRPRQRRPPLERHGGVDASGRATATPFRVLTTCERSRSVAAMERGGRGGNAAGRRHENRH